MKILFIDTSTFNCVISIINQDKVVFKYDTPIYDDMSSKILPIISTAFSKLSFNLKDTDKIFVVVGPGSFTGIRIGVSIAKTIAWGFKIPLIPLSSLEILASTKTDKGYIVPMIDARRSNVYGAIYDNDLNIIESERLVNIHDLIDKLNSKYLLVGYDIKECVKPNIDILKVINKHKNDIPINPHKLNPRYLKLTEAEENRIYNA